MSPKAMASGAHGEEVAIVGMSCIFPGAGSLGEYWENIVEGRCCIGEPPVDWGGGQQIYDPESAESDRIYCLCGGYLGDLARFDPLEYGVMPKAVDGAEPEHFLALRVAAEAMADAGYPDLPINEERTEVILGRGTFANRALMGLHHHGSVIGQTLGILRQLLPDADDDWMCEVKARLQAKLPPFNALTASGVVSSIMSGRIANRLDLRGTNYCLDAACASSLVAVEHGIEHLREGRCDAVIAGGVQLASNHLVLMVFSQLGALSHQGEIRPFDARADGTLLGEGVGMVVLKRREDAERDGHRIYALLRGVGSASDGRAKSVIAPRVEGQELALRRAYENAGVEPATVELVEAHGTGIRLGDATELESLRRVFGESDKKTCAIGSVKSMIGHLIPAAGMAGLIKAVLALHHRTLPPSIGCQQVSDELERGPFYVNTETRPWVHGSDGTPRRASVSAFGFGGINAHAVLEEYGGGDGETLQRSWPSELCVLAGASRAALVGVGERLLRFLEDHPGVELGDVAYTLHTEQAETPGRSLGRLAIVASSTAELHKKLCHALERLRDPKRKRIRDRSGIFYFDERLADAGKLVFLFPGEGSQYPGMLQDLCLHFPAVRRCFDTAERAFLAGESGISLAAEMFPPPNVPRAGQRLMEMELGVQAVTAANRALCGLLSDVGVSPDAVVGHSSGEFGALEACGMLRLDAGEAALVRYIQAGVTSVRGVAAAARDLEPVQLVATSPEDTARVYELVAQTGGRVKVIIDNCPLQVVLGGPRDAVGEVIAELKRQGIACTDMPFHRPYHSEEFSPACRPLREFFSKLEFGAPRVPIYSCATAAPFNEDPQAARELALAQWTRPVRFRETVEALYADGARLFVEVGPKNNLSTFVSDTLRKRPHVAVPLNRQHRSGITELQLALGLLSAHGVAMNLAAFYERRARQRLDLDGGVSVPRERPLLRLALPRLEFDEEDRRALQAVVPKPRRSVAEARTEVTRPATERPAESGLDPVMGAYLETMKDFLRVEERALDLLGRQAGGTEQPVPRAEVTPPSGNTGQLPFVGEIVEQEGDQRLLIRRTLDVNEELFLCDHTLGGRVSFHDPELRALAVVPMTMSMEIMAEAAQVLSPGRTLLGMRDVRAHRWIALHEDRLDLAIRAQRTGPDEVRVEVCEAAASGRVPPLIEGTMRFGAAFPAAEPAEAGTPGARGRPSRFSEDQIYQTGMFNGPAFQGVVSVERWAEDGASATLRALPSDGLFRSLRAPEFLAEPLLLDAVGQVAAHWNAEADSSGFNFFPYRFESLDFYGPALAPGTRVACHMKIERLDRNRFRSDFQVVKPGGKLHLRLRGWEDKSFRLPETFWGIRAGVPDRAFTREWTLPLFEAGASDAFCCRRADSFDPELLLGSGQIWLEVLARQVLCRSERADWKALDVPDRRRLDWLLGRVAVKDAARFLLRRLHGLELCPADVQVHSGDEGQPCVSGAWSGQVAAPTVSIAHSDSVAVAVAVDAAAGLQVGVDLEPLRRLEPGFEEVVFDDGERALLRQLPEQAREAWTLRLWCAKEAVAKALGVGLGGAPRSFVARALDARSGRVELEITKAVQGLAPTLTGLQLTASTGDADSYVVALSTHSGSPSL